MSNSYISAANNNKFSKLRPEGVAPKKILISYSLCKGDLQKTVMTLHQNGASAHYIIRQDGWQDQYFPENIMSFMAGKSYWKGETSLNNQAISIMLLNDGNSEFPEKQIEKLISTILDIQARHEITLDVLGLGEVALDRHTAPGKFFPWQKLAEAGIGKYVGTTEISKECLFSEGEKTEGVNQFQQKLYDYGYNVEVTGVYDDVTVKTIGVFGTRYSVPTECWSEANDYVIDTLLGNAHHPYSQHIGYTDEVTPTTHEQLSDFWDAHGCC